MLFFVSLQRNVYLMLYRNTCKGRFVDVLRHERAQQYYMASIVSMSRNFQDNQFLASDQFRATTGFSCTLEIWASPSVSGHGSYFFEAGNHVSLLKSHSESLLSCLNMLAWDGAPTSAGFTAVKDVKGESCVGALGKFYVHLSILYLHLTIMIILLKCKY